jgi:DHA1 family tetracycline resistance protein-like MFS transporter
MTSTPPRGAIPILFAVVFIDLVGFGILMPLIPFYVERLGASPAIITLILAIHPLCQSLATPVWGELSDRIGRRPVLLISTAGHIGAYLLLGFADSLTLLILSRLLSGTTSANIATAFACVADVSSVETRAEAMGKISAAFSLGFAAGPAIGGFLAGDSIANANFQLTALTAAVFAGGAFLAVLFFLPETFPAEARKERAGSATPRLSANIGQVARRPIITLMLVLCLIVMTSIAARETIFPLWAHYRVGLNPRELGLLITYTASVIAMIQFVGIGRLARRFGELALVQVSLVSFGIGWLMMVLAPNLPTIVVALTVSAVGSALFQTCLQALISHRAGPQEKGLVLGVYQSASSASRFVGQAGSGTLYGQIGMNAPFLLGAIAMLPALLLTGRIRRGLQAAPAPEPVGSEAR